MKIRYIAKMSKRHLEIQHLCSGPVWGNFSSYSGNLTLDFGSGVSFLQGPRAHRTFWPSPFALNWPAVIFPVEFFHLRHFGQKHASWQAVAAMEKTVPKPLLSLDCQDEAKIIFFKKQTAGPWQVWHPEKGKLKPKNSHNNCPKKWFKIR